MNYCMESYAVNRHGYNSILAMTPNHTHCMQTSIVDSKGQIKNRHIMDFQDRSLPEKELAKWLMKGNPKIPAYNRLV